ncbi:MAG: Fic family protein [Desulfatirhabdiaceae bacterium]
MENDDHYYVEGYSAESDPYAQENGVLKNNFGITNFASLNEIEADIAAIQIQKLLKQPAPNIFTPEYLCALHEQVFSEVYPWAGKLRKVDIAKGDSHFLKHQEIASELAVLFSNLSNVDFLKGTTPTEFSEAIGDFLVRLNFVHPFREGNGRVQRLLVSQIARNAGLDLDWQSVGNEAMKQACIAGIQGTTRQMMRLILLNIK